MGSGATQSEKQPQPVDSVAGVSVARVSVGGVSVDGVSDDGVSVDGVSVGGTKRGMFASHRQQEPELLKHSLVVRGALASTRSEEQEVFIFSGRIHNHNLSVTFPSPHESLFTLD